MAGRIETIIRGVAEKGAMAVAEFNRGRMADSENPYLEGENSPLPAELHFTDLEVVGRIPPELDGTYARNGPNPLKPEHGASYHWFLGDAMVHGVRLQGGKAHWYRNRWVRSTRVSEALGEPLAPGPRSGRSDTANTNVFSVGGRRFAIVEAGAYPVELGPELETVAHNPFDGTLKGPFSAHPHRDPETGLHHAICYEGGPDGAISHVVLGPDAKVHREEPIPLKEGPSIHDCAITERNILVFDLPVVFSMERAMKGHRFPYGWNPAHGSRVGVLGLDAPGDSIRWTAVAPCYVFHPANAHEEADGRITADVVAHDSMFADSTMGPDSAAVRLERWTIDPAAGTVDRRVVDEAPQEFPRIDERLTGRKHRYVWTAATFTEQKLMEMSGHLYRHDMETGAREARDFGPGWSVGEFVHVPYGPGELDGWLMGLVNHHVANESALVILDANDFLGAEVGRVRIPTRIPPGFHGNWLPA
jgi:carotenoid cleavage dioxygenase